MTNREICFDFVYHDRKRNIFAHTEATLKNLITDGVSEDELYEQAMDEFHEDFDVTDFVLVATRQFSEYEDKNGKTICENDIVVVNETKDNCYEENQQIVFMDGAFYVGVANGSFIELLSEARHFWDRKKQYNALEIIGNIYENPTLMQTQD